MNITSKRVIVKGQKAGKRESVKAGKYESKKLKKRIFRPKFSNFPAYQLTRFHAFRG